MFALKEVAPVKSKSAFWTNDIKVARAIRKGDKKIDLNVIKIGLEDALAKEDQLLKVQASLRDGSTSGDGRAYGRKDRTFNRVKKNVQGRYSDFNFGLSTAPAFTGGSSAFGDKDFVVDPAVENAIQDIVDPDPPVFDTHSRMASAEDMVEMLGLDDEGQMVDDIPEIVREDDELEKFNNDTGTGWFSWKLHTY
jgi:hypothetical protein